VHKTALEVFDHVHLLLNNLVIWNGEPQWDTARWKNVLEHYQIDGKPVFDLTDPGAKLTLDRMLALPDTSGKEPDDLKTNPLYQDPDPEEAEKRRVNYRIQNRAQIEAGIRNAENSGHKVDVITDDNLGHEYSR
jgi:hypothetical protein